MAGQVVTRTSMDALAQDEYAHPARMPKVKRKRRGHHMAKNGSKHPGFKKVQAQIAAKQGIPAKNAGAILASATRNASPAAKKKNPRLNRVAGAKKKPKVKAKAAPRSYPSPIAQAMGARC